MLSNDPLYSAIAISEYKEFQIKQFTRRNDEYWHIRNHYHDIYEIVLYEEIHGYVYLNGDKTEIRRNKLLYLPPYAVHGFDLLPETNSYIVLHLSPLFINYREAILSLPSYPVLLEMEEGNYDMISKLLQWGEEKKFPYSIRQETILMILLWITDQDPHLSTFEKDSGIFTRLLKFIDKQKEYNIKVVDAAQICNMSRSSFCDHFRKQFGTSFNKFLQEKRIEKSQYLLINTDKSCTEIAAELDFSDASHFSKLFRKHTGILPGDFRRRIFSSAIN
jgi:AraC-like DNA-binding protein/quercetin dioxygenase-like cupin family protein